MSRIELDGSTSKLRAEERRLAFGDSREVVEWLLTLAGEVVHKDLHGEGRELRSSEEVQRRSIS